ncbi:MAG TPA: extracellular solute-binding protein [bacterium]|nr:extracellular solute-binding protein [bacterium]
MSNRFGRRELLRAGGAAAAMAVGGLLPAGAGAADWVLPRHPVTITYWDSVENVKNELMVKTLIPEYTRLHRNVTIKYEPVPDLQSKLLVALSTGTAADVFSTSDWFLPKFFEARVLDPLPPAAWGQSSVSGVLRTYLPHMLDAQTDGGRLYAVPAQENAHSLFINNRLFREAGLDPVNDAPKTWIDVARLNKILTKRQGDQLVQKGWEMRYINDDGHWQAQMFQILLYQAGGEMTRDGRPVFNSDAGVRALTVWKSVTIDPRITHNTGGSPYQDFAVEQDAMTFAGPNAGASIEKINPKMAGNYTVAPLPQIRAGSPATIVYSFNWAVNAKAPEEQRRVAWDFVHFVSTRPALFMATARYLQPVKGWYDTPAARQVPFLGVFVHDLSIGRPLARSTHYPELQSSIVRMIERVILNNADAKQALDQAAAEYAAASR